MNMSRTIRYARLIALLLTLSLVTLGGVGCGTTGFRAAARIDTTYDFDSVQTFAFKIQRERTANSRLGKLAQTILAEELVERGYKEVPVDEADVHINLDIGVYAAARLSGANTLPKQEGGLSVWVYDAETGLQIWYAWAERVIQPGKDDPAATIRLAIEAMMDDRIPVAD